MGVLQTNNSTKSRKQYVAKMQANGVDVTAEDIMRCGLWHNSWCLGCEGDAGRFLSALSGFAALHTAQLHTCAVRV